MVASNVYVHDYSDPRPARPYRSCMAIRESELPSLLAGEGHPVKVELVQLAAERMADEQVGMEQLRSYVTWAAMHKKVPTPTQFILLRVLNVSVMRFQPIANLIKRALVRYLITGKKRSRLTNRRTIHLGPHLTINDEVTDEHGKSIAFRRGGSFQAIHMASSGYWQVQDDAA